eukprot:6891404-Lingulodinium_polyedra.AAC.1
MAQPWGRVGGLTSCKGGLASPSAEWDLECSQWHLHPLRSAPPTSAPFGCKAERGLARRRPWPDFH